MTWAQLTSAPSPRVTHDGDILNDKIYNFGGHVTSGLGTVTPPVTPLVYDTISATWSTISDMPEGRVSPGVGLIGNKFYIVGGNVTISADTGISGHTQLWEYNTTSDTYATKAFVPIDTTTDGKFYAPRTTAIGTTLYVLAYIQFNGSGVVGTQLISWNQTTNTWTTGYPTPPTAVFNLAPAAFPEFNHFGSYPQYDILAYGTDLFVASGPNIYKYNTLTSTWVTLSSVPTTIGTPVAGPTRLVLYNNNGSSDRFAYLPTNGLRNSFLDYEPSSDTWANDFPLFPREGSMGVLAFQPSRGRFYVSLGIGYFEGDTTQNQLWAWLPDPIGRFAPPAVLTFNGVRGNPFVGDSGGGGPTPPPPPPPEDVTQWRVWSQGRWHEGVPYVRKNGIWVSTKSGIRGQGTWHS